MTALHGRHATLAFVDSQSAQYFRTQREGGPHHQAVCEMTQYTLLVPRLAPLGFSETIARGLIAFFDRIVEARDARRTVRALSCLTDRELDDIGLTRDQILSAAHR